MVVKSNKTASLQTFEEAVELYNKGSAAASADVRAMIERVSAEQIKATTRVEVLEAKRRDLLVTGDDASLDAVDAEIVQVARLRDRLEVSGVKLAIQAEAAAEREAAEAHAEKLKAAKALRASVVARFDGYRERAQWIAQFLADWVEVGKLSQSLHIRNLNYEYRERAPEKLPDREEKRTQWVNSEGKPCEFHFGGKRPADAARQVVETVTVEGGYTSAQRMDPLEKSLKLPALTLDDDPAGYWPKT